MLRPDGEVEDDEPVVPAEGCPVVVADAVVGRAVVVVLACAVVGRAVVVVLPCAVVVVLPAAVVEVGGTYPCW